jgi:lipopolysaccharide biosynthesis glycosyltransferase
VRVFIGYDDREAEAARVAQKTLYAKSRIGAEFLCAPKLVDAGLLTRVSDHRGGQDYDLVSNAPKSTRFAISRFLTPIICQSGYALFVDCDVVFIRDVEAMLKEAKAEHAVSVVKHDYTTSTQWKMVNQRNDPYPRKNWSSVMLFNCEHPANRRLSLWDINNRPGRDLHRFYWLADSEIGELSPNWNWLVGEQPRPADPGIAHFTLGGPWIEGWKGAEHDEIWLHAAQSRPYPYLPPTT